MKDNVHVYIYLVDGLYSVCAVIICIQFYFDLCSLFQLLTLYQCSEGNAVLSVYFVSAFLCFCVYCLQFSCMFYVFIFIALLVLWYCFLINVEFSVIVLMFAIPQTYSLLFFVGV